MGSYIKRLKTPDVHCFIGRNSARITLAERASCGGGDFSRSATLSIFARVSRGAYKHLEHGDLSPGTAAALRCLDARDSGTKRPIKAQGIGNRKVKNNRFNPSLRSPRTRVPGRNGRNVDVRREKKYGAKTFA